MAAPPEMPPGQVANAPPLPKKEIAFFTGIWQAWKIRLSNLFGSAGKTADKVFYDVILGIGSGNKAISYDEIYGCLNWLKGKHVARLVFKLQENALTNAADVADLLARRAEYHLEKNSLANEICDKVLPFGWEPPDTTQLQNAPHGPLTSAARQEATAYWNAAKFIRGLSKKDSNWNQFFTLVKQARADLLADPSNRQKVAKKYEALIPLLDEIIHDKALSERPELSFLQTQATVLLAFLVQK